MSDKKDETKANWRQRGRVPREDSFDEEGNKERKNHNASSTVSMNVVLTVCWRRAKLKPAPEGLTSSGWFLAGSSVTPLRTRIGKTHNRPSQNGRRDQNTQAGFCYS